jgi:hypothetical protein
MSAEDHAVPCVRCDATIPCVGPHAPVRVSVRLCAQVADTHKRALADAKKAATVAGSIELQTEMGALVERTGARMKAELARMAASYS